MSRRAARRRLFLGLGLCISLALASSSTTVKAQDTEARTVDPPSLDAPVASASVSARRVALGRSFFVVVRVVYAAGIEISLPTNLTFGSEIEELRRTDERQENPDGSFTREFELELIAFQTGPTTIPPIAVTYTGRGERSAVRSNPLAFEVVGVIGEGEGALRDIAPPVDIHRRDYTLAMIAGGVFLGLLFLLFLVWLVRRHRRQRMFRQRRAAARVLPADEEALSRFGELEARGSLDDDDLKPAYLEMSEILKTYIARRFGFPAAELTTLEIRNELAARPQGENAESLIRSWLEAADLVKFANQQASADDARRALYDARIFVEKTRRGHELDDEVESEDADA